MRKQLAEYLDKQITVSATVKRYGAIRTFYHSKMDFQWQPTILLTNITFNQITIDHTWMKMGPTLLSLSPIPGSRIKFTAQVIHYFKSKGEDYSLLHPKNPLILYQTPEHSTETLNSPAAAISMANQYKSYDRESEFKIIKNYQRKLERQSA